MTEQNPTPSPKEGAIKTPPHLLPGQTHAADPKAEALKDPANQLPTSKPAQAKPAIPAFMGAFKMNQFVLNEYTVFIPATHTPAMLLEPSYWVHKAREIRLNDKIDCISETRRWECTLRVINKGDNWVKMRMLSAYEAQGADEDAAPIRDQFKLDYIPSQGHRVIHKETKAVISSGHQTKDAAIASLDAHVEILSRRQ